ncbi:MAG: hypothetical protein IPP10_16370 [Candidatus Competibacteraceae bacterium]|nr:hypothetical protein [Candidatus Competibacteraceae bacterium]
MATTRRQPAKSERLSLRGETELCPPDAFDGLEPDEQHFHEATGNEGASFDRTYRRAGLVLWPRARRLAVLNQVGLSATLPYLGELDPALGPRAAKVLDRDPWRQAHELAGHMLRTWPRNRAIAGETTPKVRSPECWPC